MFVNSALNKWLFGQVRNCFKWHFPYYTWSDTWSQVISTGHQTWETAAGFLITNCDFPIIIHYVLAITVNTLCKQLEIWRESRLWQCQGE